MSTDAPDRHTLDPLVTKLVAMAQLSNVDGHGEADRWYRLGQRNAFALAAGYVIGRNADELAFQVSERITNALADGNPDLTTLLQIALDWTPRAAPLEWIGPQEFTHRHGAVSTTDQDFGTGWGEHDDIRIGLRVAPNLMTGLLYAQDPASDTFALLAEDVPKTAVAWAFYRAMEVDPHMVPAAFADLVRANVTLLRGLDDLLLPAGRGVER